MVIARESLLSVRHHSDSLTQQFSVTNSSDIYPASASFHETVCNLKIYFVVFQNNKFEKDNCCLIFMPFYLKYV